MSSFLSQSPLRASLTCHETDDAAVPSSCAKFPGYLSEVQRGKKVTREWQLLLQQWVSQTTCSTGTSRGDITGMER